MLVTGDVGENVRILEIYDPRFDGVSVDFSNRLAVIGVK